MPKPTPEFVSYVLELLSPLGSATARRMFGGYGLYLEGLIVAIVIDDVLYLKTDQESRPAFEAAGSTPFRYEKKAGEVVAVAYWRAPEEALDNPAALAPWARLAMGASLRAQAGAARPSTKKKR